MPVAKIPIVVGLTGHRDLRNEDIPKLREMVKAELKKLQNDYPDSGFMMLNSLAEGADQLCAEEALSLGFSLAVPLPFTLENYRRDFEGNALQQFDLLCRKAHRVFLAPDIEQNGSGRDYGYRQAGIYVAMHSHVLLALWDGVPEDPGGCGTGAAVDSMLQANYVPQNGALFKAPANGVVIHIVTPRNGQAVPQNALTAILVENYPGALKKTLSDTDQFNRETAEHLGHSNHLVPESVLASLDADLGQLDALYRKADSLSVRYRDMYMKGLKWLAILGVALVVAFLFYDELASRLMLPVYGMVLVLSYSLLRLFQKKSWQSKYLEYRVLAETLRTQFFVNLCGVSYNVCNGFSWSQKTETVWVEDTVCALLAGVAPKQTMSPEKVRALWIDDQLAYHQKRLTGTKSMTGRNGHWSSAMMIVTLIVFAAFCILELFFPKIMNYSFSIGILGSLLISGTGFVLTLKSIGLILLGLSSAVTLYFADFFGKLSLERKSNDAEKMAALYSAAQQKWDDPNFPFERVAIELAREEIAENGAWYAYSRDNTPGVNLRHEKT